MPGERLAVACQRALAHAPLPSPMHPCPALPCCLRMQVCCTPTITLASLPCVPCRMLTLGSLPLLFVAQALLFAFGNSLVLLLPLVAAIHLFWGGRSSVMGLLAFNTLPSREALAIWQAIAIGFGSLMVLMVVAITSFANSGGAIAVSVWVPAGILMGLEALRCLACLGMTRTYGPENLSSP